MFEDGLDSMVSMVQEVDRPAGQRIPGPGYNADVWTQKELSIQIVPFLLILLISL